MSQRNPAEDELTKLTASWCNTLSAGSLVTGVFSPVFQTLGSVAAPMAQTTSEWAVVYASVLYLVGGCFLHIIARMLIEIRFRS